MDLEGPCKPHEVQQDQVQGPAYESGYSQVVILSILIWLCLITSEIMNIRWFRDFLVHDSPNKITVLVTLTGNKKKVFPIKANNMIKKQKSVLEVQGGQS